jgi:hypothetical protein
VPTGFYTETQKGKRGKSPVEIERARAWGVCIARKKVSVSGKVNVWNCSSVNYFLQLNLFKLREGESGKWVEEVIMTLAVLFTNNRRTLGDIKWCDYILHTFSTQQLIQSVIKIVRRSLASQSQTRGLYYITFYGSIFCCFVISWCFWKSVTYSLV